MLLSSPYKRQKLSYWAKIPIPARDNQFLENIVHKNFNSSFEGPSFDFKTIYAVIEHNYNGQLLGRTMTNRWSELVTGGGKYSPPRDNYGFSPQYLF
jgi:hypothetical protein